MSNQVDRKLNRVLGRTDAKAETLVLQSPSAVILEPPKIKCDYVSTVSPSISHEVMGPDAMKLKDTYSLEGKL